MSRRRTPSDASTARIEQAARAPRSPVGMKDRLGGADCDALLAMPSAGGRQQAEASERWDGVRAVFRAVLSHPCTRRKPSDPPCRHPRHPGDIEAARDVLKAAGLIDDAGTRRLPSPWYGHGASRARAGDGG